MIEEPLTRGHSPVHGLDPRCRLAACGMLSLVAALAAGIWSPLVILALGAVLTGLSRPPLGLLLRRVWAVNAFIVFLWLVLPVSVPGHPIWVIGPATVSREGVELAVRITLKANAIFLCILALVATIPAPALGRAMAGLGVPEKFSFLFIFTYRYVHVIAEEYGRLVTAARLRGFVPGTNRRTYRTYAALVAMVLVHSYDRSQRVYQAMLLRGFTGTFPCLDRFRTGRGDVVLLFVATMASVAAACLDIWVRRGHG